MVNSGVCCASLKDNKALMKMGLGLVLVGHVNFLLGALVHGAVLRHINVDSQARTMVYAISNVIAIVTGLVGIICGIAAIVLSKNKKNRILQWFLLVFSFLAGLLSIASTLGLLVSTVQAIIFKGQSLLTHCTFSDDTSGSSSGPYECPFDPTRVFVFYFLSTRRPPSFYGCLSSWCPWWKWCSPSAALLSVLHSSTSVRAGKGRPKQRGHMSSGLLKLHHFQHKLKTPKLLLSQMLSRMNCWSKVNGYETAKPNGIGWELLGLTG
ncbi:transmembrane protein 54a isoform X1 [Micropterus dolomieu]|uniref:transmembrane protein 54a isoform X1 n=1 Tax=Micropterus dolomieu TaxID=147949 RepID=UPI001E8CA1C3|nr:transmembrane protein 54a isoform X1 [Micropterus dolomieu]